MINEKVREKLIEVAKKQGKYSLGVITYGELNDVCNLGIKFEGDVGGREIGEILGEISRDELMNGRPPLSVLVGYKDVKPFTPSKSFFEYMDELANELKIEIRKPKETNEKLKNRLIIQCYNYWKSPEGDKEEQNN